MKIHRGRIAQYKRDQRLREYLKQNLNELIQQKELIIDGKVKTQIATLDPPTLKFAEEAQYLAQGAGRGGSGPGAGAGGAAGIKWPADMRAAMPRGAVVVAPTPTDLDRHLDLWGWR